MQQLITIFHIFVCFCVIGLVLMQRGKGAQMGAGFGAGASASVFGSQGATPFLVKLTAGLALLFFLSSCFLSVMVGHRHQTMLPFEETSAASPAPVIPVAKQVQHPAQKATTATETKQSVTPVSAKQHNHTTSSAHKTVHGTSGAEKQQKNKHTGAHLHSHHQQQKKVTHKNTESQHKSP